MKLLTNFSIAVFTSLVAFGQQAVVTVYVHARAESGHHGIFIAGNTDRLGNWQPSEIMLRQLNDSLWVFRDTFAVHSTIEFKITQGTWSSEAIYSEGTVPQNTVCSVSGDTVLHMTPLFWSDSMKLQKQQQEIIGRVEYHIQLFGRGLRYTHDVIVWLPPSYDMFPNRRYPVLYMHDGQNLFDPTTAYTGHDWRIDEVAESLFTKKRVREFIVVGINNSPDRLVEYSDSDLGRAYGNFVVNIVKPMIDSAYRTRPERNHTAIMGSSMGALSSFLIAWWYPEVFSMAGCMSPSFWFDDEKTLNEISSYSGPRKNVSFYLDCGTRESELLPGYKRMVKALEKLGYRKGKDLEYHLEKNGTHNEQSWAQRVWRPMTFFFKKKK